MSEVHTITANKRDRAGKGAARATRREGHVPGVIYGNKQSPVLIALDPREIDREIHKKGFYTTLFDLKVGSDAHRVLARDIQFDPVTDRVVHADFMRVTDRRGCACMCPSPSPMKACRRASSAAAC